MLASASEVTNRMKPTPTAILPAPGGAILPTASSAGKNGGKPRPLSEKKFTQMVIDLARLHGFRVAHFRPARTTRGWVTALSGHIGYPDLTLCKGPRLIFAELKTARGKLTPGQTNWLHALEATGAEVYLWKPDQWDEIEALLSGA